MTEAGWEHDSFAVCVWRSVRARGDTKTERSRRTLALPRLAAAALAALWQLTEDEQRAAAGKRIDTGLVFTTALGTVMDAGNLRRMFRRTCKDAGIGEDWTPRELRHTFGACCRTPGCGSRRSRISSATPAAGRPRPCTVTSSGQSSRPARQLWTGYSPPPLRSNAAFREAHELDGAGEQSPLLVAPELEHFSNHAPDLEPPVGIEPTTCSLRVNRSAD